eukprot:TRINITY_DN96054_c0_g1_i1.p1 TRINITY_DN96054_c0_g1~~TRINITY_DN96054_c0_g1_i1.p1  ORF type:complete len:197 (-),score=45.09 TRINITY_DN96054_c0_g1_i1:76-666(-)
MQTASPKTPKDDRTEIGRRTLRAFSPSLLQRLADAICRGQRSRFDTALTTLSLDEDTRANILNELPESTRKAKATHADAFMDKAFRKKVNTLRCLGQATFVMLLDELVPGVAQKASDMFSTEAAESTSQHSRKRLRKLQHTTGKLEPEGASAAAHQSPDTEALTSNAAEDTTESQGSQKRAAEGDGVMCAVKRIKA